MNLTQRQRTAPPIDRWSTRLGESGGGIDTASPRTLAAGLGTELARYPGDGFDTQIVRDRGPYYQQPVYVPPANNWLSWTAAGPTRPELHMRCGSWRNMVGNSASRYPVTDSPSTGMHTMGPAGVARTVQRYVTTPQMTAARVDRLRPGQYSGQSYSQTTQVQGG